VSSVGHRLCQLTAKVTCGLKSLTLTAGVSNTRPVGHMWPARAFCAARYALGE